MTTLTDISRKTTRGTAFLIEDSAPQDLFTPEDLSEEHLAVGHMVDEFWANEVEPRLGGSDAARRAALSRGPHRTCARAGGVGGLPPASPRHRHAAGRLLW